MNQEKSSKSIGWIVGTILLKTLLVGIIFITFLSLLIFIFTFIFVSKNSANAILVRSYLNTDFVIRLSVCVVFAISIVGTWLGVRSAVRHSLIRKEDFIRISIYAGLAFGLLTIPGSSIHLFLNLIIRFLFWSIFDALVTYFWLKASIA